MMMKKSKEIGVLGWIFLVGLFIGASILIYYIMANIIYFMAKLMVWQWGPLW